MTTITAQVVADSVGTLAPRLTTFLLRYPRWIHAEFMTHRVFSRNAASSRAILVGKLIEDVVADPAVPLSWGKNQKGMQAREELSGQELADAKDAWNAGLQNAICTALSLERHGCHKQIVNRVLEPFAHITVVVTATQWTNFFALRCHADAEPHLRLLADRMWEALQASAPRLLNPGDWHQPFVTDDERRVALVLTAQIDEHSERENTPMTDLLKLSVARCASTSYKTVDGFDMTLDRAMALHDKLVAETPLHASPCEHQATPAKRRLMNGKGEWSSDLGGNLGPAWVQYRKTLPGECL